MIILIINCKEKKILKHLINEIKYRCAPYLVAPPPAAALRMAPCPTHPPIAHCPLQASTLTAAQQTPLPEETLTARSAAPVQHQEGGTPLKFKGRKNTFQPHLVTLFCFFFLLFSKEMWHSYNESIFRALILTQFDVHFISGNDN